MKFAIKVAALAATAAAQQFVQYTYGGDDTAIERTDPIVSPGGLSGHVHQFFGASRLSPELTYEDLQKSDCTTLGASDGTGNSQDKSIYWHPAMYAKRRDNSGKYMKIPTNGHKLYYKDVGVGKKREPFEFPHGFRMVAGDPHLRSAASLESGRQNITQWICHTSSGMFQGTDGGFPDDIEDCDAYPGFNGAIHYPHCWNGDDFDQNNPTAHMAYPVDSIENGECPASHPIRLPHIFAENEFNIHNVIDEIDTSTFTLAMGDETGYGWHADFFNGWDDGAIPDLLESCSQGGAVNFNVGDCAAYKPFAKKAGDCKLPTTFKENVQNPGRQLPGCNPVSINPVQRTISALNQKCNGAAAGSPAKPPPYSRPGATSTVEAVDTAPTTTMATRTKTGSAAQTTPAVPNNPAKHGGRVSCPASHGKHVIKNGKTYEIECGIDHFGGNLELKTAHSLGQCINFCAHNDGCVDVSLSGHACYLKKELGHEVPMEGVAGAKLVDGGSVSTRPAYGAGKRNAHLHRHAHKNAGI